MQLFWTWRRDYLRNSRNLREKGVKVKEWWFRSRCKQLMAELHPGVEFKMSNHWFDRFKSRYDISLRRPTNAAQEQSETLRTCIQQFHRYFRRTATVKATELKGVQEGIVGPWELRDVANMDQTPLRQHEGSYLCRKRRKVSMDSDDS